MWFWSIIISFCITIIALIGFIILAIKKNPKWKSWLITSIGAFVLLIVSAIALGFQSPTFQNPALYSNTQIPLPLSPVSSEMNRVHITQVGSIDIPNSMELQSETNKQSLEAYEKAVGLPISDKTGFVAKQKGTEKYCTIIVETIPGKPGDYAKLSQNFTASPAELSALSQKVLDDTRKLTEQTPGNRMLEWYPPKVENLNGMTALVFSYRRQLADKPPVLVWEYRFQNYDRMIFLTMSYRETEKQYWEPLFKNSLETFRITNIMN